MCRPSFKSCVVLVQGMKNAQKGYVVHNVIGEVAVGLYLVQTETLDLHNAVSN